MARNPRVAAAYKAMHNLGIPQELVKPVLKNLLKLYDKNWELIEEENYRALADAIFDYEETKLSEEKKRPKNIDQEEALEDVTQPHEEPERPLKRLRLRNQEGRVSPSLGTSSPRLDGTPSKADSMPGSPLPHMRNRGKQPVSPKSIVVQERSEPSLVVPKLEPGIILKPKMVPDTRALIKPKDEPITDEIPQIEFPIALIPPGDPSIGNGSTEKSDGVDTPTSECMHGEDADSGPPSSNSGPPSSNCGPPSSNERRTDYELASIPEESLPDLEIASSPLGEVKISLSCNSAFGRADFHMPNLDAVLKLVEDKCLRSYKIIDPNFSVKNLMKHMCECVLELGTEPVDGSQENSIDVTPTHDSLIESSNAGGAICARGDEESFSVPSANGSANVEVLVPDILRLPSSLNGLEERINPYKTNIGNGYGESGEEKEVEDPNYENSHSLVVVQQHELTIDDIRSLYDVNDITKGEERVRISLVNEINNEHHSPFHYIPQNLVFDKARVNISLARIQDTDCCSNCFGDCLSSSVPCVCAQGSGGEFAYTSDGLVKEEFLQECISVSRDPQQHHNFYCRECPKERSKVDEILETCKGHVERKFIKECWSKCGCTKQCGNRLVQRGITSNLQVFLTPEGKGWGLRTLDYLPKGAFVCEYVGEILTNGELYDRNMQRVGSHTYPVHLDGDWGSEEVLKDEEALCLDASHYGNVARFINHRCLDANLVEIPVEIETPDRYYYHVALFTSRKVDAFEELTRDYGIDFDDHESLVKAFHCLCGSKFCRNMKRSKRSRSRLAG